MNKDLTDLLTEFDEMGYAPTTLMAEPEKAASEWKKRLIEAIEAENAALCKRLDKAVILPCKIGDTIYEAAYSGCIQEWIVTDISYKNYGQAYEFRMNCESKNDSKSCRPFIKRTHWNDFEGIGRARFTRAAAEKRLTEQSALLNLEGRSDEYRR